MPAPKRKHKRKLEARKQEHSTGTVTEFGGLQLLLAPWHPLGTKLLLLLGCVSIRRMSPPNHTVTRTRSARYQQCRTVAMLRTALASQPACSALSAPWGDVHRAETAQNQRGNELQAAVSAWSVWDMCGLSCNGLGRWLRSQVPHLQACPFPQSFPEFSSSELNFLSKGIQLRPASDPKAGVRTCWV